jgi:hypothetical protein
VALPSSPLFLDLICPVNFCGKCMQVLENLALFFLISLCFNGENRQM